MSLFTVPTGSPSVHCSTLELETGSLDFTAVDDPPAVAGEFSGRARVAVELSGIGSTTTKATVIDWGCGEGTFIKELHARLPALDAHACDIDPRSGTAFVDSGITFHVVQDADSRVALASHSVDTIFLLDVLEHTGQRSRRALLREAHRVLRPNGRLVITVPHRGPLHWADPENIKFRFPRAHRKIYEFINGRGAYGDRYGSESRFGNFSEDARWHQHFTVYELQRLLEEQRFELQQHVGFGLGFPVVKVGLVSVESLAHRVNRGGGPAETAGWRVYRASLDSRPPIRLSEFVGLVAAPAADPA